MKSSKFADALKGLKVVATGIKASNDTIPTVSLLGIPNKFQLNKLAVAKLGLSIGDRIRIIASESDDINTKFFIAKTSETDETGAKMSKANSSAKQTTGIDMTFNYSGVWGVCLQGEGNAPELTNDALTAKGLVVKGNTSGGKVRYRATKNVCFELEEVGEVQIGESGVFNLFAMTNRTSSAKSNDEIFEPATVKSSDAPDAPETDDETEDEDED